MYYVLIESIFRLINGLKRRITDLFHSKTEEIECPLEIVTENIIKPSSNLPEGYCLRNFLDTDLLGFHKLMFSVNIGHCSLKYWKEFILPGGFFVVEEVKTRKIVGALFAAKEPNSSDDDTGTMGFLATSPDHRGLKIASTLAYNTASRLLGEGYGKNVIFPYEHRLDVIGMYERQGWKRVQRSIQND
jgi:GNAT superfamily N-acetyltransferase